MNRIVELVTWRILVPALFWLAFTRLYKTQEIATNAVIRYNRSLRA